MIVVGLTGSIAMGKSEVAKVFRAQGFPVFDADAAVHELYAGREGVKLLKEIVPEATRMDRVDRTVLKQAIQADEDLLPQIEKQVHGHIRKKREAFVSHHRAAGCGLVVLDIPLLFETGVDSEVDVTIVVSSNPEQQRDRALARPAMTEQQLALILKRQMPDAEKRKRADHVIENNGSLAELQTRTIQLITKLQQGHRTHA